MWIVVIDTHTDSIYVEISGRILMWGPHRILYTRVVSLSREQADETRGGTQSTLPWHIPEQHPSFRSRRPSVAETLWSAHRIGLPFYKYTNLPYKFGSPLLSCSMTTHATHAPFSPEGVVPHVNAGNTILNAGYICWCSLGKNSIRAGQIFGTKRRGDTISDK